MVLLVVAAAEFLTTFMVSSINVALRPLADQWAISAVTLSWISLAYILAAAALLMPAGRLADLYGRKRFFVIGVSVFAAFALVGAGAPSSQFLIAVRALQGIGTAIVYACCTAMVSLAYPPERRGRALGIQIACVYLGLTLGPLLGGVIIDGLSWRWVFVVVGVLGGANAAVAGWRLKGVEWREPKTGRFDVAGSCLWAVALALFLSGLSSLPGRLGWILAAAGVAGVAGFFWLETRASEPVLSVDLFRRNRVFLYSNAATLINYAATFALTFLISLYLEYNRGLSPEMAGLILASQTVVQTLFSPVAGLLADRMKPRHVASTGMAICVLALLAFAFLRAATPDWYIVAALCALGVGLALFSSPIVHAIMGSVERRYTGVASATIATMRMTGQNISMGIVTVVLAVQVGRHSIGVADYPALLTSAHVTFAVLAALGVLGVAASLVGPGRAGRPVVSGVPDPD